MKARKAGQAALAALAALLPLACWANLERPFSTPKTWVLAAMAALSLALARRGVALAPAWPLWVWLAGLGLSAAFAPHVSAGPLALAALPLLVAWGILRGAAPVEGLRRALVWGSALLAALACAQWGGFDPFAWFGWHAGQYPSARMRVYGAMGNPDFVAAWLCGALPLTWPELRERRGPLARWLAPALLAAGIAATGSRVALLAVPAGALAYFAVRRRLEWWAPAVLLAALVPLAVSSGRPLETAARGRLYLVRTTLAHAAEVPLTGFGAGSFEAQFSRWQVAAAARLGETQRASLFAGLVDHPHNDVVEFYVEYGAVGAAAFLFVSGWALWTAWRLRARPEFSACAAALLACSLVDFPFHRPAEWALLWMALAAAIVPLPATESRDSAGSR